jgi:hypothetical protein
MPESRLVRILMAAVAIVVVLSLVLSAVQFPV